MSLPIVLGGDADFERDCGGDCESDDSDDGSDMDIANFNTPCM